MQLNGDNGRGTVDKYIFKLAVEVLAEKLLRCTAKLIYRVCFVVRF